jgi:hypothetical protein
MGDPVAGRRREFKRDLAIRQQLLQPLNLDIDDGTHVATRQPVEQQDLVDAMMWGTGGLPGLGQLDTVTVIGPVNSEHRSGMVSFLIDGHDSLDVVEALNADGVRTHARKRDYYSATVLEPLGVENCVRASASHYNTRAEVEQMLATVNRLAGS